MNFHIPISFGFLFVYKFLKNKTLLYRRKSPGFEGPFDLMNSNSSNNMNKPVRKRVVCVRGKGQNTKQKNLKNSQYTISEENNTHENDDSVVRENSKTEQPRDYSASGGTFVF